MPSPELNLINSCNWRGSRSPCRSSPSPAAKAASAKPASPSTWRRRSQQRGRRVVLLDGDLGLANVDVFLGLSPRYTLAHVLSGERTLDEIS